MDIAVRLFTAEAQSTRSCAEKSTENAAILRIRCDEGFALPNDALPQYSSASPAIYI
jgi:hypothetical protein